ncbi:MAG: type II toxin-antitoxin system HicA family toxin [Actinobacteria bacterium]|nr:type II toxin-antitoxin system HicA family toxin [Actinomycetota bacterium]
MKRRQLEQHLKTEGARKLDEGGNHTRWVGPSGRRSAVPRHREIDHRLARAICRQLGIGPPGGPR